MYRSVSSPPALVARRDRTRAHRCPQAPSLRNPPARSIVSPLKDSWEKIPGGAVADSLDLMQGTLDVLILKALSWDAMHGYGITTFLRERTGGAFEVEEGALYHALHRLDRRGLVTSQWGVSENNRKAKYYELTTAGRQALRKETLRFERYARAVFDVLGIA